MRYKILCSLVAGVFINHAHAQGVIETLVVTGSAADTVQDLAPGIARIDTADRLPGLRIDSAELLQGLPGVQADSRSNYAQDTRVTLRGFGARSAFGVRGIDLLIDGVPLTTPDGQGQLSSVALDGVTAVEVLRGPMAALYGNGAGGVISLQSTAPEENSIGLRLIAGENDLARQSVQGQWRQGNLGVRVNAANFTTDGDRPHAEAERRHAGAQFYYSSDSGIETIVRIDTSRDPLLQDPLGLSPEQWEENPRQLNTAAELFDTRKTVAHEQASITMREAQGATRWQASLWRGEREITQYLAFTGDALTSAGGVVDLAREFHGASGNFSQDFTLGNTLLTATLGAELAAMEDRRRGFVNNFGEAGDLRRDELGEVNSRDVYTILQWQLSPRWQVYGGARHSDIEFEVDDYFIVAGNPDDSGARDFSEWSSALGINYTINDHWTLFASSGRGFETPTLTETAYRSGSSGLNIDLDTTHNRQHETGIRFEPSTFTELTLTLFTIESTDEIVVDQSVGGRTTYRNAAETERRGIEIAGRLQLADAWSAWVNVNYLDADYSAGEWNGNSLPGVAQNNHYAQLRWQPLLDERLTLAFAVQHRSKVATADNNEDFAPAATTADLALSTQHDIGDWQLQGWIKAANLTDERYVGSVIVNQSNGRSFEPAPGRNTSIGIEASYRW